MQRYWPHCFALVTFPLEGGSNLSLVLGTGVRLLASNAPPGSMSPQYAVGAVAPTLFPREAEARRRCNARCRCRRKKGVRVSGDCKCTVSCTSNCGKSLCTCHDNSECHCYETLAGEGFCGTGVATSSACATNGCENGQPCIVLRNCAGTGQPCGPLTPCSEPNTTCINGTCQLTACVAPCST